MTNLILRDIPSKYYSHLVVTPEGAELSEAGKKIHGDVRWVKKFDLSKTTKRNKARPMIYKTKTIAKYKEGKPQNERYELCTDSPQEVVAQEEDK